MELVQREIEVPKELNDIGVLIVSLAVDLKAKKPVMDIVRDSFGELIEAAKGFDQLSDEVKSEQAVPFFGLLLADVVAVFMKKADAPMADVVAEPAPVPQIGQSADGHEAKPSFES